MEDAYNFNNQDFPKIVLQLLVDMYAYQQAFTQILVEKLDIFDIEKDEIVKYINDEMPALKETILSSLYESFGKTPDV